MKLIAFDWNGTLIDDLDECLFATNKVLERFAGKTISMDEFRMTIHIPIIDFYVQHGLQRDSVIENSHDLSVVFHTFYEKLATECDLRKGMRELLEWLHRNDVTCIVLSNHTVENIGKHLARLGVAQYFTDILANTRLDAPVSEQIKLDKLRTYMEEHNYGKEDVAIVGDSLEEIEVGRDLGVTCISLKHGHIAESRIAALNPDYFLDDVLEIRDIVNSS